MSTPTPPPPPAETPMMSAPPPPAGPSRDEILSKVKGPAIAMMIAAGLSFILVVFNLLARVFGLAQPDMSQFKGMEGMEWVQNMQRFSAGPLSMFIGIVALAAVFLIFFGGLKMMNLQNYGLAMTGAILALIPCFTSCCCIVSIPIGIWALIVLLNQDVKQAFA